MDPAVVDATIAAASDNDLEMQATLKNPFTQGFIKGICFSP